jgi:hypothetical protein
VKPYPAQGWYRDPFHVHEDRYFSAGNPTKLVRDGSQESNDDPPDLPYVADDASLDPPYSSDVAERRVFDQFDRTQPN